MSKNKKPTGGSYSGGNAKRQKTTDSNVVSFEHPAGGKRKRDVSAGRGRGGRGGRGRGGRGGGRGGRGGRGGKPLVLSRKDRKELKKKRKSERPHADVVATLGKLWGAPWSRMDKKSRREKIDAVLEQCEADQLQAVSCKHDAARALQIVLKHGVRAQRERLLAALVTNAPPGEVVNTAMHHYGHHVLLKLLQYCNADAKATMLKALKGSIRKVSVHADGAKVLDFLYAAGSQDVQAQIKLELYGPQLALLEQINESVASQSNEEQKTGAPVYAKTLGTLVQAHSSRRDELLSSVRIYLEKATNKHMLGFRFMHTLVKEYLDEVGFADKRSLIEQLTGLALSLYHSKDGAMALAACFSYGSAKHRKQLIKALKGSFAELSAHEFGHLVVIRALQVVDDTVLLAKTVISELEEHVEEMLDDSYGGRVLLYLLAGINKNYFNQREQELLAPTMVRNGDMYPKLDQSSEEAEKMVCTSKKEAAQRKTELLRKFLPRLLDSLTAHVAALIHSRKGSRVLYEALREASERAAKADSDEDTETDGASGIARSLSELLQQVASLVAHDPQVEAGVEEKKEEEKQAAAAAANAKGKKAKGKAKAKNAKKRFYPENIMCDLVAHYVLKWLLLNMREDFRVRFAEMLWEQLREPFPISNPDNPTQLARFAVTNRGAFVITSLVDSSSPEVRSQVVKALEDVRGDLEKDQTAGAKVLLEKLAKHAPKKASKPTAARKRTPARKSRRKK